MMTATIDAPIVKDGDSSQIAGSASHPANATRIKRLQEDEWHRQWSERNNARYKAELTIAHRAGRY
jgi:hypothetical protein